MFKDVWGATTAFLKLSDAGLPTRAKVAGVWSYDKEPVELEGLIVGSSKHDEDCWMKLLLENGGEVTVGDAKSEKEDVQAYSIMIQPVVKKRSEKNE